MVAASDGAIAPARWASTTTTRPPTQTAATIEEINRRMLAV